jgi:predicted dehydrogenase
MGVLGTANIARGFVESVASSTQLTITSIASRTAEKAKAFATEANIPGHHDSYERMIADPYIDAIYVPLPNSLHASWVIQCLDAGKHVLCEKPLACSEDEAKAMFESAKRNHRVLLEAYPYMYQPQTQQLLSLIRSGAIGQVRAMQGTFGFTVAGENNIRLDTALGGGALMDAGCYPISLARLVFGMRPLSVMAHAHWGPSGVDLRLATTLHYRDGITAQIFCSMDTAVHRRAFIMGSNGIIDTDYLNHALPDQPGMLRLRQGTSWGLPLLDQAYDFADGFRSEAQAFVALVRGHGDTLETTSVSMDVAATLDAILASARANKAMPVRQA